MHPIPESSSPPSYSSRNSVKSESSRKRKSYTKEEGSKRHVVGLSVNSRSSGSQHSTTTDSSTQSTIDILKTIPEVYVRRSKCRPEFLEELAVKGGSGVNGLAAVMKLGVGKTPLELSVGEKVKVVTGVEGVSLFKKFIGARDALPPYGNNDNASLPELAEKGPIVSEPYLVFAVGVVDAGRKVVEYYMTWRGKTRTRPLKGSNRRGSFLDDEFRRVAKTLDKEFERVSMRNLTDNTVTDGHSHKSSRSRHSHSSSRRRNHHIIPPNIIVSAPVNGNDDTPATPKSERPMSANDSVISLQYIDQWQIRNVPLGNRRKLRVMNPDTASIEGVDGHDEPDTMNHNHNHNHNNASSLETLVEATEHVENGNSGNNPGGQTSVDTLVHTSDADQRLEPPKKEKSSRSKKGDGASIVSSSGSKSSSSRSSKSRYNDKDKDGSKSESYGHHHHHHGHHSSSRKKEKDSEEGRDGNGNGNGDGESRKHRHRSSRHGHVDGKEKDDDDDDAKSRKSEKSHHSHSSKKSIVSDYVIVLLDTEMIDKNPTSWHSLSQHDSSNSTKVLPVRVTTTPWSGPLARSSDVDSINPTHLYASSDVEGEEYEYITGEEAYSSGSEFEDEEVPMTFQERQFQEHQRYQQQHYLQQQQQQQQRQYQQQQQQQQYQQQQNEEENHWQTTPVLPYKQFTDNGAFPGIETTTTPVIPPIPMPTNLPHTPVIPPYPSFYQPIITPGNGNQGTSFSIPGLNISLSPLPSSPHSYSGQHGSNSNGTNTPRPTPTSTTSTPMMRNGSLGSGLGIRLGNGGSPFLYSSPRPVGSPYVTAWISPLPQSSMRLPGVVGVPRSDSSASSGYGGQRGGFMGYSVPGSVRGTPPF